MSIDSSQVDRPKRRRSGESGFRRANWSAVICFVLVLCVGVYTSLQYLRTERLEREQQLIQQVDAYAGRVQQLVNQTLSAAFAVAAIVRQSSGLPENMDRYARELIPLYPGVDSVQLAPDGVIAYVYPPKDASRIIGLDILNDAQNRDEAQLTRILRRLHVAIPPKLQQGGVGLVGRYPIYLQDPGRAERFWGFASAIVSFETLKAISQLEELETQGLAYQLWRMHPVTGERQVMMQSHAPMAEAAVNSRILAHDGVWTLSAAPASRIGWEAVLMIGVLMSLGVAIGLSLLVRYVLLQPIRLAELVRKQTHDLRQKNLELQREAEVRRSYEHELRQQATHDTLTGLGNRTWMMDRLAQAVAQAQRNNATLAVLLLDLDNFKNINDSLGHRVGDRILQKIAKLLSACVSVNDSVSRLGGDEFVILLTDAVDAEHVASYARTICLEIRQPHRIDGTEFHVAASLGVAMCPQDDVNPEALLSQADMAMYRAKQGGRNRFEFFSKELDSQARMRLQMEDELRRAIRQGEFEVYYQAKVGLGDGQLNGMEALLRWQHPQRGMIAPADFIPLAEETGLIVPLGEWVLRTACMQARQWHGMGGMRLSVAVNISAKQFQDEALLSTIGAALADSGLPADCLELEVTESLMMVNPKEAVVTMQALREIGVALSLDDFGTGYSSLTYLQSFPMQKLKIDRSFVNQVLVNPGDAAIVHAIIAMGKALNLGVIAEGVETRGQLEFLRQSGCDVAQGYLFGRPCPANEFAATWLGSLVSN